MLNWAEVRHALLAVDKQSAAKALASLPKVDRERLDEAINLLGDMPVAGSALKGELEGLRRLRVGYYRLAYELKRCYLFPGCASWTPPPGGWLIEPPASDFAGQGCQCAAVAAGLQQ